MGRSAGASSVVARAVAAVVASSAATAPAAAVMVTAPETQYYDVSGVDLAAIQGTMRDRGIRDPEGRVRFGEADAFIRWTFAYRMDGGRCRITDATVEIHTHYILPRLVNAHDTPDPVRRRWAVFADALAEHERGHAEIALEAARIVEGGILSMAPAEDCDSLGAATQARANEVMRFYDARQVEYDRMTGHGTTQGAWLP